MPGECGTFLLEFLFFWKLAELECCGPSFCKVSVLFGLGKVGSGLQFTFQPWK